MTELKRLIGNALKEAGFSVADGMPWSRIEFLDREKIGISIRGLSAEQGAVYRYLGMDENGQERYGMALKMETELSLQTPKADGGAGCERYLETVLMALLAGVEGFPVGGIQCGAVRYDGTRDCYQADIQVTSRVLAYGNKKPEEEITLQGFRILASYQ